MHGTGLPWKGIYTGYVAHYVAMGDWEIKTATLTAYVNENTGALREIRYRDWRVLPWGEAHKMGEDPGYNPLVDPEWFTLDEFLDYLDEVDGIQ